VIICEVIYEYCVFFIVKYYCVRLVITMKQD